MRYVAFLACVSGLILTAVGAPASASGTDKYGAAGPISGPVQLTYGFETGKVYHYKLLAFFNGEIPTISAPGQEAHIKAELYYSVTPSKSDAKGTSVAFAVEAENLSLLKKEQGKNRVSKPEDELPFGLPLSEIQSIFNVTVVLRPDGSIAEITGGNNDPIKINLGVELRKMFVLILPIVFSNKAVSPGATWSFNEGFLGKKEGSTTYTGKLDSVKGDSQRPIFHVSQVAASAVAEKLDKEGNSSTDPNKQVGTLTGNVTADGAMEFAGMPLAGMAGSYIGRLVTGKMELHIDLKRVLPDTDNPGKTKTDPINVRADLAVHVQPGPPKTDGPVGTVAPTPASTDKKN